MERVCSLGQTVESTMANTPTTKKRAKEFSFGQMDANMMENGSMENNTVLVSTQMFRAYLRKENGLTASV